MEIRNRKALVLGGWGQVGFSVCRQLAAEEPAAIILSSLTEDQAVEAASRLEAEFPGLVVRPVWGNLFTRSTLKDVGRCELLSNPDYRAQLIEDVIGDFGPEALKRQYLYELLTTHRPDVVIDCVNTATALAYQDTFRSARNLIGALEEGGEALRIAAETQLCTLYLPQLIRHVQTLYQSLQAAKTKVYVKVGTSGTGGMGLNIPYTHSEEKPSPVLLSKSGLAGAHTMLLFLMARTPGAPIIKEVKPAAVIAWKGIGQGEVRRGGRPIPLYDCPPSLAVDPYGDLTLEDERFALPPEGQGEPTLRSVFIDTGENGVFSAEEFIAITTPGQMEFVTPEEIASNILFEIKGGNSGHEIINALDYACMGPTYRAGAMREAAIAELRRLEAAYGVDSVAFELLGPPRLSKLLYEAYLLKRSFGQYERVVEAEPAELARALEADILETADLRSRILSIGLPILLADGHRLLRGPTIKIPPHRGAETVRGTPSQVERWIHDGWVDLREVNMERWQQRLQGVLDEVAAIPVGDSSSRYERNAAYWLGAGTIEPGKVVSWLFMTEEKGSRMKS